MIAKKVRNLILLTLACHPVMLAILSPYMLWFVGLTRDQYVTWVWSGLPVGMLLNAVLGVYIPFAIKKFRLA